MDPSLAYVLLRDSFNESQPTDRAIAPLFSWPPISQLTQRGTLPIQLLSETAQRRWTELTWTPDPTAVVRNSRFADPAAVELGALDAVFALSQVTGGYLARQDTEPFSFCDLSTTAGWSAYLQWRRPYGYGFGMTTSSSDGTTPGSWSWQQLNRDWFQLTYGPDNSGAIAQHGRWFGNWVRETQIDGVDLVVSRIQAATPATIQGVLIAALLSLAPGGSCVVRLPDTWSPEMARLIYLGLAAFDHSSLYKPLTSAATDPARYLVGLGCRANIEPLLTALGQPLTFALPDDFVRWLTDNNNTFVADMEERIRLTREIGLDTYRCLVLWNLPDDQRTTVSSHHSDQTPVEEVSGSLLKGLRADQIAGA